MDVASCHLCFHQHVLSPRSKVQSLPHNLLPEAGMPLTRPLCGQGTCYAPDVTRRLVSDRSETDDITGEAAQVTGNSAWHASQTAGRRVSFLGNGVTDEFFFQVVRKSLLRAYHRLFMLRRERLVALPTP